MSPPNHLAKRRRMDGCDDDSDNNSDGGVVLPPEILAKVFECLPLDTLLSCAQVNKTSLQGMALVKRITIDSPYQLHSIISSRYLAVTDIYINFLLRFDDDDDDDHVEAIEVENESALRIVPFLSRL